MLFLKTVTSFGKKDFKVSNIFGVIRKKKNRSKSSLIVDLFKVLITFILDFQPWFLGALSSPMSLVSFDV